MSHARPGSSGPLLAVVARQHHDRHRRSDACRSVALLNAPAAVVRLRCPTICGRPLEVSRPVLGGERLEPTPGLQGPEWKACPRRSRGHHPAVVVLIRQAAWESNCLSPVTPTR
jgi:hypothetical protein